MNAGQLLRAIHSRTEHRGIITADHWLRDLTVCLDGRCPSGVLEGVTKRQWNAWLKAASQKPTYQGGSIGEFRKAADGNALPPHTIATFPAIITTTTQDRDGDILESKGAQPDPLMPLLWQHIPDMPIGRLLGKAKVQSAKVTGRFTIANTPIGQDAALLTEHGALRISHGFLPLKWEPLEDGAGFHILEFKILETSLVSVPSNPDAVIEAFSREKLAHPLVKAWAGAKFDARPAVAAVGIDLKAAPCACHAKTKGAVPFKKTPAAPQGEAWDADAAVKGLREWAGVNEDEPSAAAWSKYEQGFGYVDGDGGKLTAYSYPHHEVKDGKLVVNFKALAAGIAALNGARGGGSKLSDAGRKAVYAHLKKHYEAFPDEEVPELKAVAGMSTKGVFVEFENSWDDIRQDLSDSLLSFLMSKGTAGPADWAYIVDMFPDHAIVCVCVGANAFYGPCAVPVCATDDNLHYYSLTWAMGADEEPSWTGEPQRIEITPNIQPAAERALRAMIEAKAFLKDKHVAKLAKAMDQLQAATDHEDATAATKKLSNGAHAAIKSVHDAHDKGMVTAGHKAKLEKAMGYCATGAEHEDSTPPLTKAFEAAGKHVKDVMDDAGGADEAAAQAVEKTAEQLSAEKAAELQTKAAAKLSPSAIRKIKSAAFHFKAVAHHDDAGNEHAELAEKAYQPLQDMLNQPDSDAADDDYNSGKGEPSDKAAKLGKGNLDKLNTAIGHGETLAKHKTATPHIKSLAKHAVAHLKSVAGADTTDDPEGEAGVNGAVGTEGANGNPPKSADAKSFSERCAEMLDEAIDLVPDDDALIDLAAVGSKAGKLLVRNQARNQARGQAAANKE